MNLKSISLSGLISLALVQSPVYSMQQESKTRRVLKKASIIVGGIAGTVAAGLYLAPRILSHLEKDELVETNHAYLYKDPHAEKYLLELLCSDRLIFKIYQPYPIPFTAGYYRCKTIVNYDRYAVASFITDPNEFQRPAGFAGLLVAQLANRQDGGTERINLKTSEIQRNFMEAR